MNPRPVLLDTFCKAGGATKGYQRAGFYVIGVDIEPQPNYCGDEFYQMDALTLLAEMARGTWTLPTLMPDAVHASPVCLTFARVTAWRGRRENHPDTLRPTLARLSAVSVPWVIENVPEACPPLRPDFRLCGSQFGLTVKRHRIFQAGNWGAYELMPSCNCRGAQPFMHKQERAYTDAMGCTWMTRDEGRQAIPPAYTEHIGRHLLAALTTRSAS